MSTLYGITSAANPLLKDIRRAVQRGGLTADGLCVAEGFHLLAEALRSPCEVVTVLASESASARVEGKFGGRILTLPDPLFHNVAATETSQGVMALVRPPEWSADELFAPPAMVIVLDGVQDPGNAGAILRACEAFGATGAIFLKGTVSPWHPKILRASAGSFFRLPFLAGIDAEESARILTGRALDIHAAMPFTPGMRLAGDADLRRPTALVIGSEGHGISAELRRISTEIAIPTTAVESLNAAMAASILLYEMRRQRA